MGMNELTVEQRIERSSLAVITHPQYRALGGVVMMGKTSVSDEKGITAFTDGFNVEYGRAFVATVDDKELGFIVLHETMHKALRHLTTWLWMWKEDPMLANLACDYVINLLLVLSDPNEQFIRMPEVGALDHRFKDMDAGQVYRILKKEQESGGGKGAGGGQGFDQHGWGVCEKHTPEVRQKIEETVTSALQQGTLLIGKMGGDLSRAIQDILAPQIDWREELREFVMTLCSGRELSTWRRPHRRSVDSGNYTPSVYSEAIGRIVVGVDTSGSIDGKAISAFLSEVKSICELTNPEMLDLLYWDGKVASHEKYGVGQYESLLSTTRPKGGGGTRPSCVSAYLSANSIKPECVVMLTDGIVGSDWGSDWTAPVLWCITGNKRTVATTGRTVHIKG